MSPDITRLKVADIPRGAPPQTFPEGRRCERCGAKLSIYNRDDLCSPCRRGITPKSRSPLSGGQTKKEFTEWRRKW